MSEERRIGRTTAVDTIPAVVKEVKAAPLTNVYDLATHLANIVDSGLAGVHLSGGEVIDRYELSKLANTLGNRHITEPKMQELSENIPGITGEGILMYMLVGRFYLDHDWPDNLSPSRRKSAAKTMAIDFLQKVARLRVVPRARREDGTRLPLDAEFFKSFAEIVAADAGSPGSVAAQLANPLPLAGNGLRVSTGEDDERGSMMPKLVLDTLADLMYEDSAENLRRWAVENYQDGAVLTSLTVMAEFLMFLDDKNRFRLWKTEDQRTVRVMPFHALVMALDSIIDLYTGWGWPVPDDFRNARERLNLRFSQVQSMQLVDIGRWAVEPTMLYPNPAALVDLVADDYTRVKDFWTEPQAARYIAKIIEQSGIDSGEIWTFIHTFESEWGEDFTHSILKEVVKLGLIRDHDVLADVRRETLESLRENPFVDFAEMNVADLIKEDEKVDGVHFHILTCTLGPGHQGHEDLIKRQLALIRDLEELDRKKGLNIKRFILIHPITRVDRIEPGGGKKDRYSKDFVDVGSEAVRLGSLMLLLADLDEWSRERVLMTTTFQQSAPEAGTVEAAVASTMDKLRNKFRAKFGKDFGVDCSLFMGSDELTFNQKGTLLRGQRDKLKRFSTQIIARHGHLIDLVRQWELLKRYIPLCDAAILTADAAGQSSSGIRAGIMVGDYSEIPPISEPFILEHYGEGARRQRRWKMEAGEVQQLPTRSVTEICQWLIREYASLIGENGY